jgi:putative transcriptional regulator
MTDKHNSKLDAAEALTIAEIRASTGLSQAAFAKRFHISLRAVESWEGGQRTPPEYVKLLLAQVCGLTDIFKDEG